MNDILSSPGTWSHSMTGVRLRTSPCRGGIARGDWGLSPWPPTVLWGGPPSGSFLYE
jgi:hypothetical protein